jgi:6-pyruvoyltetrahydropterin/6-carboxytetrahydropterin synthase
VNFHGQSYICDVTVSEDVEQTTGVVIDPGLLDRVLSAEVPAHFEHRNIKLEVLEFADGGLVPTGDEQHRS